MITTHGSAATRLQPANGEFNPYAAFAWFTAGQLMTLGVSGSSDHGLPAGHGGGDPIVSVEAMGDRTGRGHTLVRSDVVAFNCGARYVTGSQSWNGQPAVLFNNQINNLRYSIDHASTVTHMRWGSLLADSDLADLVADGGDFSVFCAVSPQDSNYEYNILTWYDVNNAPSVMFGLDSNHRPRLNLTNASGSSQTITSVGAGCVVGMVKQNQEYTIYSYDGASLFSKHQVSTLNVHQEGMELRVGGANTAGVALAGIISDLIFFAGVVSPIDFYSYYTYVSSSFGIRNSSEPYGNPDFPLNEPSDYVPGVDGP